MHYYTDPIKLKINFVYYDADKWAIISYELVVLSTPIP